MKLAHLAAVLTASATMLMSNGASAQGYNYRNSPNSNNGIYGNHRNRQGYAVRPSNVVFVGGQYIGQDPDPHVRAILRRDFSGHLGNWRSIDRVSLPPEGEVVGRIIRWIVFEQTEPLPLRRVSEPIPVAPTRWSNSGALSAAITFNYVWGAGDRTAWLGM